MLVPKFDQNPFNGYVIHLSNNLMVPPEEKDRKSPNPVGFNIWES